MAIASTSCKIRDQSATHAKQMLHLNYRFSNDTPFSPRCFAEFDHDPESSSSPPVFVEDLQQQFTGTGIASDLEKKRYLESIALSSGTSGVSSEIAHIMQGRVASYPVCQQPSIGHESFGRALSSDFGSLGVNEFADFWGDILLYSQEMATAAVLPPQTHGWIEGSTPYTTSGNFTSTTVSVSKFERPLGQHNYTIPTRAESWGGQAIDLESLWPLQHVQSSYPPQPVGARATSIFSNPSLSYHGPSRTSKAQEVLSLSSTSQPETPQSALFPSLQPSTSRKSTFHSQTLARDRFQDSAVVDNFRDSVDVAKVFGPRQHNFVQQELRLSMPRSPVLQGECQPGECGIRGKDRLFTSENLNHLKLKQKSLAKPASRKYQRRRILPGIDMEHDEVDSVPTPLDNVPDNVQRERQRRDLMTSKIAALELLLPKSAKRDRASIVYDAIQLLKRLERDVKDLQQRFHEAKLRRADHKQSRGPGRLVIPKSIHCNMETCGNRFSNGIVIKPMGMSMKPVAIRPQPKRVTSGKLRPTRFPSGAQCLSGSNVVDKGNVFVEFHVHLDDTVTVQEEKVLKCRCRMDYLSTLVGVVDEFQLDLTSCNIMKLFSYFICIMRLRARTRADMISAAQFAVRLQSVVDVDIASEAVTSSLLGAKISEKHIKVKLHPIEQSVKGPHIIKIHGNSIVDSGI